MITDEKYLVYGTFYWVTSKNSGEKTIAYVFTWYDEVVFYICGRDEKYHLSDFINVHPVAEDMDYQCAICGEDSDGPYYCPDHKG